MYNLYQMLPQFYLPSILTYLNASASPCITHYWKRDKRCNKSSFTICHRVAPHKPNYPNKFTLLDSGHTRAYQTPSSFGAAHFTRVSTCEGRVHTLYFWMFNQKPSFCRFSVQLRTGGLQWSRGSGLYHVLFVRDPFPSPRPRNPKHKSSRYIWIMSL